MRTLSWNRRRRALPNRRTTVSSGKHDEQTLVTRARVCRIDVRRRSRRTAIPVQAGYELTNWFGLALPGGVSRDVAERVHGDVAKVLQQPDVRAKLVDMGADVIASSPAEFAAFLKAESAKWARVIKDADIRAE
jgi:Tripartite tricarboxylate transporter family receptor